MIKTIELCDVCKDKESDVNKEQNYIRCEVCKKFLCSNCGYKDTMLKQDNKIILCFNCRREFSDGLKKIHEKFEPTFSKILQNEYVLLIEKMKKTKTQ